MKNKKILVIIIIVLIMFKANYGLVVSDNNGMAFVTKGEFDALKNSFNKDFENYYDSINSKTDGAIASFLSGISLSEETSLEICKTNIQYPLTLRMLGAYNGNNVRNIKTLNIPTKLWTDAYEVLLYGTWSHVMFYTKNNIKKSPNNEIKNFYNGKVSSGKYYIDGMYNNYNVKAFMNTNILQSGYRDTADSYNNFKMSVFFDVNSFCPTASHNAGINSWDRKDLMYATNERKLTVPTDVCPIIWDQYMNWNTTTRLTNLTSTSGIDKKWNMCAVASGGTGYRMCGQNKTSWTQQASYNSSKINDILCGSVSSNTETDLYVPVLYDGKIKITNINEAKEDLQPTAVLCNILHGYDGKTTGCSDYIEHLIDPGFVIEPESNIKTSSTWQDASLINASHCYYIERWPVSGINVECCIKDGIPLCDIEDDASKITMKFTPSWTSFSGDSGKRIMFSKEPITETTFNPNISSNKDKYLDVSNAQNSTKSKYVVLDNGVENNIYIYDLQKDDKIYYKITWETGTSTNDENYKKTVIVSEPKCIITYAH